MIGNFSGGGVKVVLVGAPVEVEPHRACSDVIVLTFQRGYIDVEEVA